MLGKSCLLCRHPQILLVSWEEKGKDPGDTGIFLSIKSSQSLPPCSFCIINSPWGWNKLWARLDISLHLVSHQVVLAGLQPVDELVNEC